MKVEITYPYHRLGPVETLKDCDGLATCGVSDEIIPTDIPLFGTFAPYIAARRDAENDRKNFIVIDLPQRKEDTISGDKRRKFLSLRQFPESLFGSCVISLIFTS